MARTYIGLGKTLKRIKTSAKESLGLYELKQHKPWFDECLGCLDQRKHDKMQWLQDPSHSNVDDLNNVRHEAGRHFRNKKKENLKAKLSNLKLTVRLKILGTCTRASMA